MRLGQTAQPGWAREREGKKRFVLEADRWLKVCTQKRQDETAEAWLAYQRGRWVSCSLVSNLSLWLSQMSRSTISHITRKDPQVLQRSVAVSPAPVSCDLPAGMGAARSTSQCGKRLNFTTALRGLLVGRSACGRGTE